MAVAMISERSTVATAKVVACPCLGPRLINYSSPSVSKLSSKLRHFTVTKAQISTESQEVEAVPLVSNAEPEAGNWVAVCRPEDLPKGVRKEVEVDGQNVLIFWYRNQIYAIEARSPAEGAYSEGFIKAKFTQDYCIECPSTGSLFSLKDGSIVSWYPNNLVLKALTPQSTCRNMEIYPVKLTQEALYVDVSVSKFGPAAARNRGGAGTSIEENNVFSVMPTVYFEGMDPSKEAASMYADVPAQPLDPVVALTATAAVGAVAVAGTALAIYNENLIALAVVWISIGGAVAYVAYNYVTRRMK